MELDLSVGVTATPGKTGAAEEITSRATELAEQAARSGTFGVGGALIDRRGNVYAEAVNAVVRNGVVADPTAHVERQLIDWYFAHKQTAALPSARELIIVSSLDPCAMCAGAILKAGFSAFAIADDPVSGVHENGRPRRMPEALWRRADANLKLASAQGLRTLGVAIANEIPRTLASRCEMAFQQSLETVRSTISQVGDGESTQRWTALRDLPSGAFVPDPALASVLNASGEQLATLLGDKRSCLIDDKGRPLLTAEDAEDRSPARSSVLELIRAYTAVRRQAWEAEGAILPHPRGCAVLQRRPPASPEQALLNLGALGSFLEAPRFPNRFPLLCYLGSDSHAPTPDYANSLPPLYREVIGVSLGPLPGSR